MDQYIFQRCGVFGYIFATRGFVGRIFRLVSRKFPLFNGGNLDFGQNFVVLELL